MFLPKEGSAAEEYEDAFWPPEASEGAGVNRFAVADGATETSFSGLWARLLVRAYCDGDMDSKDRISETLRSLQEQWRDHLNSRQLPWYAQHKLLLGAFAALIGLTISPDAANGASGTWDAVASGDSCLVQVRGEEVVAAFPLDTAAAFNTHPILLSTDPQALVLAMESLKIISGTWQSGDQFFLMSDALAAWFFRELEENAKPWEVLRDLEYDKTKPFGPWVASLRTNKAIRNDDVTLYRIEID